jgi:hypothetical protein
MENALHGAIAEHCAAQTSCAASSTAGDFAAYTVVMTASFDTVAGHVPMNLSYRVFTLHVIAAGRRLGGAPSSVGVLLYKTHWNAPGTCRGSCFDCAYRLNVSPLATVGSVVRGRGEAEGQDFDGSNMNRGTGKFG